MKVKSLFFVLFLMISLSSAVVYAPDYTGNCADFNDQCQLCLHCGDIGGANDCYDQASHSCGYCYKEGDSNNGQCKIGYYSGSDDGACTKAKGNWVWADQYCPTTSTCTGESHNCCDLSTQTGSGSHYNSLDSSCGSGKECWDSCQAIPSGTECEVSRGGECCDQCQSGHELSSTYGCSNKCCEEGFCASTDSCDQYSGSGAGKGCAVCVDNGCIWCGDDDTCRTSGSGCTDKKTNSYECSGGCLGTDPCCKDDGTGFLPNTEKCASGISGYLCEGGDANNCGASLYETAFDYYCTGSSGACDGSNKKQVGGKTLVMECDGKRCDANSGSCVNDVLCGDCLPGSGSCCDSTGNFKPEGTLCYGDDEEFEVESICTIVKGCGAEWTKEIYRQQCNGESEECSDVLISTKTGKCNADYSCYEFGYNTDPDLEPCFFNSTCQSVPMVVSPPTVSEPLTIEIQNCELGVLIVKINYDTLPREISVKVLSEDNPQMTIDELKDTGVIFAHSICIKPAVSSEKKSFNIQE